MANHTITVVNKGSFSRGQGNGELSNKIQKGSKVTSSKVHFDQKNNIGNKVLQGIRVGRTLNVGSAVGMLGGGASIALAVAQETAAMINQGVNIYSQVMEAKSGETMKYNNLRQGVTRFTKPISYLKKSIWDYSVIAPMQINRQNEMLNYDRQLTGSLILGKSYYNTFF